MRDAYVTFFKHHRLLPDEVGRQNPWILFKMIDSLADSEKEIDTGENEYLDMFYGK